MTMRIELKNTDQSRTCRILVRRPSPIVEGWMSVVDAETKTIGPGETGEVWLHSGQDCILEEVQPE